MRNPLSEEEPGLRTTLLPGLLATLSRNLSRGQRDLALFEHGAVFPGGTITGCPKVRCMQIIAELEGEGRGQEAVGGAHDQESDSPVGAGESCTGRPC